MKNNHYKGKLYTLITLLFSIIIFLSISVYSSNISNNKALNTAVIKTDVAPNSEAYPNNNDNQVYDIVFNLGYETQNRIHSQLRAKHGSTILRPSDPVRDGYEFVGWTLYNTNRAEQSFDFGKTPVEQSLHFLAVWRPCNNNNCNNSCNYCSSSCTTSCPNSCKPCSSSSIPSKPTSSRPSSSSIPSTPITPSKPSSSSTPSKPIIPSTPSSSSSSSTSTPTNPSKPISSSSTSSEPTIPSQPISSNPSTPPNPEMGSFSLLYIIATICIISGIFAYFSIKQYK